MVERGGMPSADYWQTRASQYNELPWVVAPDPMKEMLSRLNIKGNEFVVDVGTGSQAVLCAIQPLLCHGGRIVGFDSSVAMLNAGKDVRNKKRPNSIFVADATHISLSDGFADIAIARQVIHHIEVPENAITEMARIVKPAGRVVIVEHVVVSDKVMGFERGLFDIKEPGRHLWLPDQLVELVCNTGIFSGVDYFVGVIPGYPMLHGWLTKSGLTDNTQREALEYLKKASPEIKKELNIRVAQDEVTMDGHYLCVIAKK